MLKYIEFCAGGGGMRAGLDAAGWQCVVAIDNDLDAVSVHRLAHGDAHLADVTELSAQELPEADVWVAGFPCQPFSTSGSRLGFEHRSGNVFDHLAHLIAERRPPTILLENVEGLRINKSGHTMAVILSTLTSLGYHVSWLVVDLRWFGVPQTRPRLFIIATLAGALSINHSEMSDGFLSGLGARIPGHFGGLLARMGATSRARSHGQLKATEVVLRPAVGKPRPTESSVFGAGGFAVGADYTSFDFKIPQLPPLIMHLGDLVAPSFRHRQLLRSGRYYARGGPTRLCLRTDPVSHCVGTSLGGAPLFAIPLGLVKNADERAACLEFANWYREQDGLLVMRIRPDRAVMLFGPHTDTLCNAVAAWDVGDTRKYRIVGNMVAPVCVKMVAELINEQFLATPKARSI
jgi:DNA-cytosine methyltransferase